MNKKIVIGIVGVALVVGAFVAGAYLGPKLLHGVSGTSAQGMPGAPGAQGGPMANLSDEERAKIQNMSENERRAYFQKQMGSQDGQGQGQNGQGGPGGRMGGGIEGEVLSVTPEQVTVKISSGGSQNVYLNGDTVIAYAKGVEQKDLANGDKVVVLARPATDGVMTATTIVVK